MRRVLWLVLLGSALFPQIAHALQLRWAGDSTDVTVSQSGQYVLVIRADSAEVALPNSWRLQWTADSLGLQFSPFEQACIVDTAKADSIIPPMTAADSTANMSTAYFCSSGSDNATTAHFLIDLPGGGHGKLKVVAINPTDTTQVIESNEVTFNAGVDGDYPPALLSASSVHQSLQLSVSVVGTDLSSVTSLGIAALNGSWTLPLAITAHSDSAITGVAPVAALLPACAATIGSTSGASSAAHLAADAEMEPDIIESGGCSAQYFEELVQPPPTGLGYAIQPKDFAFTPGFVDPTTNRYALHLFYIRHSYYTMPADSNERNIGHAWSSDFVSWHGPATGDKPDTLALRVRAGKFDARHVWAPTIIHPPGPYYYMFYTGVGTDGGKGHQRIGFARSTDLNTWAQSDTVVLSAPQIPWVKKNPNVTYGGSQQLRDPFVMEYPVGSGNYVMYFVAVDSSNVAVDDMAVGAATSSDLIHWTAMAKPFAATERPTFQGHTSIVESPHLFTHNGQWWMPYTLGQNEVFFETTTSADPTDTIATHWSSPVWLRGVSQGRPAEVQYWHATEHLGSGATEWLAAFDDNAISIDIKGVFRTDSVGVDSLLLDCPPKPPPAGVGDGQGTPDRLRLSILQAGFGALNVDLRMALPWATQARMSVYDVAGRRLTTLVDRWVPAGVTDIKWNETDESGHRIASGVYFIRLSCAKGAQVSKVVLLR